MNKEEIYELLRSKNIEFECVEHPAVHDMEDFEKYDVPNREIIGRNLFVRDQKKKFYYLITVRDDKKVDLREFAEEYWTGKLSFASEDDLGRIIGVVPGAVSPIGALNDNDLKVTLYIDRDFMKDDRIGIHPCDNTATIWLKTSELIKLVEAHGNEVNVVKFK